MKKMLKDNEEKQIGKFLGLLLSKYLKEGFMLVLLGSQRIQKQSKILQMKKARELWALIFEKGDQNEQEPTDWEGPRWFLLNILFKNLDLNDGVLILIRHREVNGEER